MGPSPARSHSFAAATPRTRPWLAVVLVSIVVLAAMRTMAEPQTRSNRTRGCIESFDAGTDYFPDKVTIAEATQFSVEYHRSYKVVTLQQPSGGGPAERYVLLQCGAPPPAMSGALAGAQLIRVPATSVFAFSTTQLPLLVDLSRTDALTGVADISMVNDPVVQARIKTGQVVEFARGLTIDAERVVAAHPSVLMAGTTSSATVGVIKSAGIPAVADNEWLEPTALARAEWLKYMALFLNEERQATTVYDGVRVRYRAVATRAAQARPPMPLVMTGISTHGTFVVSGGRSYVAALIKDAGARYVWADNTATGSFSVDLEAQIRRAATADFWINGGVWKSQVEMLQEEPRYAEFKPIRTNQVWLYDRNLQPNGSNDYWSRSVSHPDLLLADLVKIFHSDLMADREFEWYVRVPVR